MLEEIIYWWGTRELRRACRADYRQLMMAFQVGTLDVPLDEAIANLKNEYVKKGLLEADIDQICGRTSGFEG